MQITLLSCSLDTGLYHNMVTFSLAPNQRLGNKVHNCKMAYYHDRLNRATSQLTFCTLSGGCNPWFVYLYKISPIKSCTQALPVQVEKLKKKSATCNHIIFISAIQRVIMNSNVSSFVHICFIPKTVTIIGMALSSCRIKH